MIQSIEYSMLGGLYIKTAVQSQYDIAQYIIYPIYHIKHII